MRTHQLVLQWIEGQLSSGQLAWADGSRPSVARRTAPGLPHLRPRGHPRPGGHGCAPRRRGSGPEAGTVVIADPTAALGSALRLHVATSHLPVKDIVETRVLLESWAASRARPESPALAEAARLLEEMDSCADTDEFLALDVRFHLALADAAGNAVVSAMMGSLREAIQDYAGGSPETSRTGTPLPHGSGRSTGASWRPSPITTAAARRSWWRTTSRATTRKPGWVRGLIRRPDPTAALIG